MKRWMEMVLALGLFAVSSPAQKKSPQVPTLGPPPATSEEVPHNAITTDRGKLLRVRKVYVERIDNNLSDELLEGLSNSGRFMIVLEREKAEGVIRGTCFDSRRLKVVHSEVFLSDRITGDSIWQDNVRQPYNPPPLKKAVKLTADAVLKDLASSIVNARNH
jgi:hypothetical protein